MLVAHPRLASRPPQEQNGDSHHSGDWRGPGRDLLPLPVRSRKYQEGPDAAERRPREGGHSPLDSAEVRVQMPRTVGSLSSAQPGARGPHCPSGQHTGAEVTALAPPGPAGSARTVLSCEPHPAQPAPRTEQPCPAWGRAAHGRRTVGVDGRAGLLQSGRCPSVPRSPSRLRVQRSAYTPPPAPRTPCPSLRNQSEHGSLRAVTPSPACGWLLPTLSQELGWGVSADPFGPSAAQSSGPVSVS